MNLSKLKISNNSLPIILFSAAFIVRILYLFVITDPNYAGFGYYDDAYYYWDTAHTSKEYGFPFQTLELKSASYWDPYFWSLMHPLLSSAVFSLAGSSDIAVMRGMTAILGSISVAFLYILCKRYWNLEVALSASLFAALNPVGIFNDASGLSEPIGIFFLILSIFFWPKNAPLTGIFLSFALMTRAEYWVISLLLIGAIIVTKSEPTKKKVWLFCGYIIPVGLYMQYLNRYTGNPITPFLKNFVTNILRGGMTFTNTTDLLSRILFLGILILGLIIFLIILAKKPKGFYLLFLGSLNLIHLGIVFGLSNYSKSLTPNVWFHRYLLLFYIFVGIYLSIFLFSTRYRFMKTGLLVKTKSAWIIFFVFFGVIQSLWIPIYNIYRVNKPSFDSIVKSTKYISEYYTGGKAVLTHDFLFKSYFYLFYRYAGIGSKNTVTDMRDPYFLMTEDPDVNWQKYAKLFLKWIKEEDIRIIITYEKYSGRYTRLSKGMSYKISPPVYIPESDIVIYMIK